MGWKDKPTDGKTWINNSMELQILLACNWDCIACDAFSQFHGIQFTRKATMSILQIERFVAEMHARNAYIGRIRILGGEPTLHKGFADIVRLLDRELVLKAHVEQLEIITNGSHPEKIEPVKHLVRVRVSGEKDKEKHHVANLIHTPKSLGYEGKICSAPWHCGFSLNYYGYFPCSAGAGIARVRDWMKWQRLELPVSIRETWPDLQGLCDHCYHGLRPEHKIKCGTSDPARNAPGPDIKQQLDEWLAGKQPTFAVYGATSTDQPQLQS